MSGRSIVLIVIALVLTVGTVFFARNWLDNQRALLEATATSEVETAEVQTTFVLVAKHDLPAGALLQDTDFRWQGWPDEQISENYLIKGELDTSTMVGAVVRRGIAKGEPIVEGRIVRPGDRGFLAAVLRPGYRAVSIRIDAASGISGLVFPGDRVDIILSQTVTDPEAPEIGERRVSETVLTNVRVLALDQFIDDQNGEPRLAKTATLEFTPKQVETVAVARELGSLSLSLRSLAQNQEELDRIVASGETFDEPEPQRGSSFTWGDQASVVVPNPHAELGKKQIIQVSRGGNVEETKVEKVAR